MAGRWVAAAAIVLVLGVLSVSAAGPAPQHGHDWDAVQRMMDVLDTHFGHNVRWEAEDPSSTYLWVEYEVVGESRGNLYAGPEARWEDPLAYWSDEPHFAWKDGMWDATGGSEGRWTSCDERHASAATIQDCPPADFSGGGKSGHGGTFLPGPRWLQLVTPFGAVEASPWIEISTEDDVVRPLRQAEGTASLLLLEEPDPTPLGGAYDARLEWQASAPFVAWVTVLGDWEREPDLYAFPSGTCADSDEACLAAHAAPGIFAGEAGSWTFLAKGGLKDDERPMGVFVGILENAPVVNDDGTLHRFAPTSWMDEMSYAAEPETDEPD